MWALIMSTTEIKVDSYSNQVLGWVLTQLNSLFTSVKEKWMCQYCCRCIKKEQNCQEPVKSMWQVCEVLGKCLYWCCCCCGGGVIFNEILLVTRALPLLWDVTGAQAAFVLIAAIWLNILPCCSRAVICGDRNDINKCLAKSSGVS